MRTKIFYYVLLIVSIMTLGSCDDKSTEGLTRITYYPTITLNEGSKVIVEKGTTYKEPGYVSTLNGEDVSGKVTVSGSVDTAKSGVYKLTYTTVKNDDGFSSTATRTVVVLNTKSPIEGFYTVSSDSYRTYNKATATFGKNYEFLIVDNLDGTYDVSDMFAGWYDQRAGYGPTYAMAGKMAIDGEGKITLIDSHIQGWGDSLVSLEGTSDTATGKMTVVSAYMGSAGIMKFFMTWTKKAI